VKRVKVAHLTSVHAPLDARIFYKECGTLAEAGYEVVLIAPHERDGLSNKIRTRTVAKPTNRVDRMTRTAWQIFRTALDEDAEVYHFHDPELITVGLLLRLFGKRVVYDVHEDVPRQILNKSWIPYRLRHGIAKMAETCEIVGSRIFNGVVTATPVLSERFPKTRTITVQNFPLLSEFAATKAIPYSQRLDVVTYVGGLDINRGVVEMVQAMGRLPDTVHAKLVLAGKFDSDHVQEEVRRLAGWQRVEFLGHRSRADVVHLLSESRIGMNILHPIPNYYNQPYSTKMFEYMASGLPIIASDFAPWREFLEKTGCALFVNPLDADAVAGAIRWLLENPREAEKMGERGKEMILGRYNWAYEGENLLQFYQRLVVN
jgi:glycosyltransferase involved in cell wall biosynthesis